jgi:hypothetical protein
MFEEIKPHLYELRKRLGISLASVVVLFFVMFSVWQPILSWMTAPLIEVLPEGSYIWNCLVYDNSSNIIGVANRGNSKLYHCVLNLIQNGKIVKTKYIGDLDEDDYDSTIIKGFSGEIHVLCYDKNHNNISKYDKIYIPKEIKKETNILILFFIVLILIILVFAIKKFVEKQKRKQ